MDPMLQDAFFAGDLLAFAKTGVRNTAFALTETATPYVRDALVTQLQHAIDAHAKIFNYMYARGLYPAYRPERVIQGDFRRAQIALQLPVGETSERE